MVLNKMPQKAFSFLALGLFLFFSSPPSFALDAETLYNTHCLRCHGAEGNGKGPAYTNLRPWPRNFQKGEFKFRSTPLGTLPTLEDLEKSISKGILRSSMPPFETFLSKEEIRTLAQYILDLSGRSGKKIGTRVSLPTFRRVPEDLTEGKKAYRRLGCVQCHGEQGQGLGPAAGNTRDDNGWWIQPTDLTDKLTYGGGSGAENIYLHLKTGLGASSMPHYGETVESQVLWQIARYVESIQVPGEKRELVSREKWNQSLPDKIRGEYLTRAMACGLCHTNYRRDGSYRAEFYLSGGVRFYIPGYGDIYTRNITSDKETGIGNWTKEQIVQSIRKGKAPERQLDALGMPWPFFYHLTDADAEAIAAYLQTLKPVRNKIPERKMEPFWKRIYHRIRHLLGLEYARLEYWAGNAGETE